jgi:hypothetical protein
MFPIARVLVTTLHLRALCLCSDFKQQNLTDVNELSNLSLRSVRLRGLVGPPASRHGLCIPFVLHGDIVEVNHIGVGTRNEAAYVRVVRKSHTAKPLTKPDFLLRRSVVLPIETSRVLHCIAHIAIISSNIDLGGTEPIARLA